MAGVDTGVASVSTLMKEFYDKLLLERLTPKKRYDQFATLKNLPKNEGKTVVWNRLTNLGSGYALTELSVPGLSAMSAAKVSASITEFGYLIGISEKFERTSISSPVKDAVALLADSASLTIDNYFAEEIGFGSACSTGVANAASATYLSARTQGFPLLINNTIAWTVTALANTNNPNLSALNVDRIRRATTHLRSVNALPFDDGYFVGIIDPVVADMVMQDANWASWNQYTNPDAMYKGEIGKINGVRFVDSTNAIKKTMLASAWSAGASQFSAGGTLYGTLIFGKGAYGGVKHFAGDGVKTSIVGQEADKADPLGQYGTAGYSISIAAKILNPSCGVIAVDYITA